jgi:hypothetical protein
MTGSLQSYRFETHVVDELHDSTPELFLHDVVARFDQAVVGEVVGIRIAGAFDSDYHSVTPGPETALIRSATGIIECPLGALEDRHDRASWGVGKFLEAQHRYWGWLEVAGDYEPLGGELCPGNAGIDALFFRDAIGVLTRPEAYPLPLADIAGLPDMVAALFVQNPATARRGKATRRTVAALAMVFSGITGLKADRSLLAEARDQVSSSRS